MLSEYELRIVHVHRRDDKDTESRTPSKENHKTVMHDWLDCSMPADILK